jgi:hypothetical protein
MNQVYHIVFIFHILILILLLDPSVLHSVIFEPYLVFFFIIESFFLLLVTAYNFLMSYHTSIF